MSKLRSIDTKIWSDTWFEELTPNQKLIFIYLITNDKTNMLGIYEVSIRKISFDTGIRVQDVKDCIKYLENQKKIKYTDKYIIMVNFLKYQKFNPNMKKSAIDTFNRLPLELRDDKVLNKKDIDNAWETLCKAFGNHSVMVSKYEVEVEDEVEKEGEEREEKITSPKLFYENQLVLATELKKEYQMFVNILFGKNDMGIELNYVLKIKDQVTYQQFVKLVALKRERKKSLAELLLNMQNKPKSIRGNTSLYMTLRKWLQTDF